MNKTRKLVSVFTLLALMVLAFASPVYAFEGRDGEKVVIGADEVIEDDLYVGANEFVLDGTVKGDLIVGGSYHYHQRYGGRRPVGSRAGHHHQWRCDGRCPHRRCRIAIRR